MQNYIKIQNNNNVFKNNVSSHDDACGGYADGWGERASAAAFPNLLINQLTNLLISSLSSHNSPSCSAQTLCRFGKPWHILRRRRHKAGIFAASLRSW